MVEGATPEVTQSARESNSLPIGDATLSNRADIPSTKSKQTPMIIHTKASFISPLNAIIVAIHPEIRLQHVNVLGTCFVIQLLIIV